jgi:hypothetical protein
MKNILLLASSVLTLGLYSCGGSSDRQYPQQQNRVTVSPMSNNVNIEADAGNTAFDVNALSGIVQKSTDPKTLEQQINDPATNINNLDLDKDGKVDFLTVTETGANQLQINDAAVNPSVVVAKLNITPDNSSQTASMQIDGTPAYCGPNYSYYQPHISFGTMLFMAYLLRPHPYYMPMYGYGHYPGYYSSRRTIVRNVYHPTASQYSRGSNSGSSFSRPSGGQSRSSLSTPSSSQRSFNTRSSSAPVGSGGFGNSSSRSGSSGRSSFGSGRSSGRSFGRRR